MRRARRKVLLKNLLSARALLMAREFPAFQIACARISN
jgi:hypothetical protein